MICVFNNYICIKLKINNKKKKENLQIVRDNKNTIEYRTRTLKTKTKLNYYGNIDQSQPFF